MSKPKLKPLFIDNLKLRNANANRWKIFFQVSTYVGIIFLTLLLLNILNQTFGYVAISSKVDPDSLTKEGVSLEQLSKKELITIIQDNVSAGLLRQLQREMPLEEKSQSEVYDIVVEKVFESEVSATWTLADSLMNKVSIRAEAAEKYPKADLVFYSWVKPHLLSNPQSSNPLNAGVRTAIFGSLWIVLITVIVAFPIGVGSAIYLEEYASNTWFNRIIQTNINNLAGVPSIIYGMLGLAIFVRTLEPITSGAIFGSVDPTTANGRTILSAGLTLALLVLPLIIINAREAIKAVPDSIRQASYGVGATRWQTTWSHVIPGALRGILTGTILAISRAMGETAPLVVIGASTYIVFDPNNIFSKFTVLPIQIYQWTTRPQPEFRNLAAGAIIVLMLILLSMNAIAIYIRNKYRKY
ncbi:MAG: phosphate ABC transporter, permease protein PstA [Anaerolinea sp.]|nr:phosphate ABC transporter, permease protein PstA [Anaerolinea sp.]